jgi:hypothetical protein
MGTLWGLLLAAFPALWMTSPYRLMGFLVAGLACAALSGALGTLVAGRWAAKKGGRRSRLLVGVGTGALQGLGGGIVAALLIWALMAIALSGFTLRNPVELSVLMSPRVFLGSFFVALSAFAYALAGGVLLGPIFGTLVNRTVSADKNAAGEKEDPVVR